MHVRTGVYRAMLHQLRLHGKDANYYLLSAIWLHISRICTDLYDMRLAAEG